MISFWLMQHGSEFFILFLIPIVGLILDFFLDKRKAVYTLGISILLLLPILTSYTYVIPYAYQILGLLALGCIYRFYSRLMDKKIAKIISAILITGLLFIILSYFAFMDGMSGSQTVENTWKINNYKIEYIKDKGFSGGALMKYKISKYAAIPILIKEVDYAIENDTTNSCIVHFTDINKDFDKCKITLTEVK